MLARLEAAVAEGLDMRAQVSPRAVGLLLGLDCTLNPFLTNPVWQEVADQPAARQAATMSDPEFRRRVLEAHEVGRARGKVGGGLIGMFDRMFPLTDPPEYEPDVGDRSEEHTSELQSLMRLSYAVLCLKKKQISTNERSRQTSH